MLDYLADLVVHFLLLERSMLMGSHVSQQEKWLLICLFRASGCRALRSSGLSDIVIRPDIYDETDWSECLDAFEDDYNRTLWLDDAGKFQQLVQLREGHAPPSVKIFENATLDVVDAVAKSHNWVRIWQGSSFFQIGPPSVSF